MAFRDLVLPAARVNPALWSVRSALSARLPQTSAAGALSRHQSAGDQVTESPDLGRCLPVFAVWRFGGAARPGCAAPALMVCVDPSPGRALSSRSERFRPADADAAGCGDLPGCRRSDPRSGSPMGWKFCLEELGLQTWLDGTPAILFCPLSCWPGAGWLLDRLGTLSPLRDPIAAGDAVKLSRRLRTGTCLRDSTFILRENQRGGQERQPSPSEPTATGVVHHARLVKCCWYRSSLRPVRQRGDANMSIPR